MIDYSDYKYTKFDELTDPRKVITELTSFLIPAVAGDAAMAEVAQGFEFSKSTCGYLCSYVLFMAGCVDPRIINRNEPKYNLRWKDQVNISILVDGAKKLGAWVPFSLGKIPKPGDIVFIGTGILEHVCVFFELDEDNPNIWHTGDGGQQWPENDENKFKQALLYRHRLQSGAKLGSDYRQINGWVDVDRLFMNPGLKVADVSAV